MGFEGGCSVATSPGVEDWRCSGIEVERSVVGVGLPSAANGPASDSGDPQAS
jgi:hypothetical protein